ncbi:hypothetical protein CBP31_08135 [Oceanisphaera profunda]|uniref:RiboL-PSP-HEPN domain-containing protein n=1 Tax=Oceanisphaera profunda TaxID=1416627 RepID=A0A1Y0D4Y8_9GAMM|nr:MAE_28990/MAE_18760 family HEPN-like nuclease [Oceanisphaera profunda]ART82590.1 hypothetical protein CBP31_08135 [Oceanisphaera profunda]
MSKIRTVDNLQTLLDKELSWRIKEIASIKILVRRSDSIASGTAVRAAIPLLYGHWEGFVKNAATLYLQFVNDQSLKYSELINCFVVFGIKKKINDIESSMSSETSIAVVEFLFNEQNKKAKLQIESAIRTESNLSSKVFSNILKSIGFDTTKYETRFNLIDESLLKRRNYIAHGEYLDVQAEGFRELADDVLLMLRWFKDDIENAVTLKTFMKPA